MLTAASTRRRSSRNAFMCCATTPAGSRASSRALCHLRSTHPRSKRIGQVLGYFRNHCKGIPNTISFRVPIRERGQPKLILASLSSCGQSNECGRRQFSDSGFMVLAEPPAGASGDFRRIPLGYSRTTFTSRYIVRAYPCFGDRAGLSGIDRIRSEAYTS